jgi:hypothetical protein
MALAIHGGNKAREKRGLHEHPAIGHVATEHLLILRRKRPDEEYAGVNSRFLLLFPKRKLKELPEEEAAAATHGSDQVFRGSRLTVKEAETVGMRQPVIVRGRECTSPLPVSGSTLPDPRQQGAKPT